jgi:protein-S-isoprenylcysteine O-methyltransferase Ste14
MPFLHIESIGATSLALAVVGAGLCLLSYLARLACHVLAGSGRKPSPSLFRLSLVLTFAGYLGWGFWSATDPVKMDIRPAVAVAVGAPLAAAGLALFLVAEAGKHGVGAGTALVTTGIYARIRHPQYVGLILLHVGYPLVFRSFAALASTLLWAAFIFAWTRLEEKGLERRWGEAFRRYRERTWF